MNDQPSSTLKSATTKDKCTYWANQEDLVKRLCDIKVSRIKERRSNGVVFLVGAALSQASDEDSVWGVPNTEEMVAMLREELDVQPVVSADCGPPGKQYQKLFNLLYSRSGPNGANKFLRRAVACAYNNMPQMRKWGWDKKQEPKTRNDNLSKKLGPTSIEECAKMERRLDCWEIPPGTEALGSIVSEFHEGFGSYLLTTNFDPLLTIAIKRARGQVTQTALHGDSNPGSVVVSDCHLIHLHGYWYRDQLHTPERHVQDRTNLHNFLKHLIRKYSIVVMGYGGWEDEFTSAIKEVVTEFDSRPNILWCVNEEQPNKELIDSLEAGVSRGRVCFYSGIDCNKALPAILNNLRKSQEPKAYKDAWNKKIEDIKSKSINIAYSFHLNMLKEGIWILISSHGARYKLYFKGIEQEPLSERKSEIDQGPFPLETKPLFEYETLLGDSEISDQCRDELAKYYPSPELGFLKAENSNNSEIQWHFRESDYHNHANYQDLRIGKKGIYELIISTPFDGTFHWCREYLTYEEKENSHIDGWCKDWEKQWIDKWSERQDEDQRAHDLWIDTIRSTNHGQSSEQNERDDNQEEKQLNIAGHNTIAEHKTEREPACKQGTDPHEPVNAAYVAIHLIPWPMQKYKLDETTATAGYWIKFASHGRTYVVKLDKNGELTEWSLFDVTRRMRGRWWIDDSNSGNTKLYIWLRNWRLEVEWSKLMKEMNKSSGNTGPCPIDAIEYESGTDRRSHFMVAHLLPCLASPTESQ
jgi:hypothetical protein